MMAPMPRQKRYPTVVELRHKDRIARCAVRGLDLNLAHIIEQAIEPTASDDANLRAIIHFSQVLLPLKTGGWKPQ
jgi:hypothetical protein